MIVSVIDYTIENYFQYCSDFTFQLQKNRQHIHPEGFHDCFLRRSDKIIFMHVDKCASSSMSSLLREIGLTDMSFRVKNINATKKYFLKNNYNFYSISRCPKDRYISGLQEFIKNYNPPLDLIESSLKSNKFIFDEHTSPQVCFLFLCDGRCKNIKLDNNISNKISKILNRDVILPKKNNSIQEIKNISEKLFKDYCENNPQFIDLYKEDFLMYERSI
mgnify:CR=1 FL=1